MNLLEIPYWVPHGDTSIAAYLTLPPDPSRLVALLQVGGGVPRTHRNRAWVLAARQLAERRVATLRMDYPGTGDSTGEAALSLERPPADAVITVIEHAQGVTGIDRVGVAGQCLGVRTAIEAAAAISACDRLALVMPVTLRPALRGSEGPRLAAVRKATAGRLRRLKRRARQRWDHLDVRRGAELDPAIGAIARHADVLVLHGGTGASRAWVSEQAAELTATSLPHHVEMRALPTVGATGFRALDVQLATRAALTEWFAQPDGS
jgi:dienelactone hydrolase